MLNKFKNQTQAVIKKILKINNILFEMRKNIIIPKMNNNGYVKHTSGYSYDYDIIAFNYPLNAIDAIWEAPENIDTSEYTIIRDYGNSFLSGLSDNSSDENTWLLTVGLEYKSFTIEENWLDLSDYDINRKLESLVTEELKYIESTILKVEEERLIKKGKSKEDKEYKKYLQLKKNSKIFDILKKIYLKMKLIAPLWRGDLDDVYYYIYFNGYYLKIEKETEKLSQIDTSRWRSGNYFQTYEEARPYARKMAQAFTNIFNDRSSLNT